jgi:predicted nucleic acid-binding protein
MILTAAIRAGASLLWSEDLNDGQTYDGTVVRNPFNSATRS